MVVDIVKTFADSINAEYSAYDENKAAVIIPIGQHRHQTVLAESKTINNSSYILLTSKISSKEAIKDEYIYEKQKNLLFGKLVVENDHLAIKAYIAPHMPPALIKEIFNEIAAFGDIYEKRFTGKDIY